MTMKIHISSFCCVNLSSEQHKCDSPSLIASGWNDAAEFSHLSTPAWGRRQSLPVTAAHSGTHIWKKTKCSVLHLQNICKYLQIFAVFFYHPSLLWPLKKLPRLCCRKATQQQDGYLDHFASQFLRLIFDVSFPHSILFVGQKFKVWSHLTREPCTRCCSASYAA